MLPGKMLESPQVKINALSYDAQFERIAPGVVRIERSLLRSYSDYKIDVFGRCWVFLWAELRPSEVSLWTGERFEVFDGICGILLPPYSISLWRLPEAGVSFRCLVAESAPTVEPLFTATVFRGLSEFSGTWSDVSRLLISHSNRQNIDLDQHVPPIARKMRHLVAKHYLENLSIAEMVRLLNVPHGTVTRAFQRAYHITAIAYRNMLRLADAGSFLLMRDKPNISDICHEVGFSDLSAFNKQFKKYNEIAPQKFRFLAPNSETLKSPLPKQPAVTSLDHIVQ
jgi:AraC-like DNA-binding protein